MCLCRICAAQVWPFVHPHLLCINAAAIAPWNDSTPLDRRLDDDKRSAGALVLAFAQARAVAAARYGVSRIRSILTYCIHIQYFELLDCFDFRLRK